MISVKEVPCRLGLLMNIKQTSWKILVLLQIEEISETWVDALESLGSDYYEIIMGIVAVAKDRSSPGSGNCEAHTTNE
jgi:hypothetical protein